MIRSFVLLSVLCLLAHAEKTALFAVGDVGTDGITPGVADVSFKMALENAGYNVTLVDDDTVALDTYVAPTTFDLVVVSASVLSTKVADTFYSTPSDFLSWEEAVYDDMGMTKTIQPGGLTQVENGVASDYWGAALPDNNYPYPTELTSITMDSSNEGCPMAAGLTGVVDVYTVPYSMSWGNTAVYQTEAQVIATINTPSYEGSPKAVIFAYDKGSLLADNTRAIAKRVGFFTYHFSFGNSLNETLSPNNPADGTVPLNAAGQALLEAAIEMDLCGGADILVVPLFGIVAVAFTTAMNLLM